MAVTSAFLDSLPTELANARRSSRFTANFWSLSRYLLILELSRSTLIAMVRISIPTLPLTPPLPPSALTKLPLKEAAAYLNTFLVKGKGKTVILSGAGVSVDSGIRASRGKEGHYSNPNYK
jgi:hypothetical protein